MESLAAFLSSPLGVIAAAVAAFLVGMLIFDGKKFEAHWKQWAVDTSQAMAKAGLIHTPKVLSALAVGDLAGAFREIKSLADIFKDPKQLAAEFQTVFQNILDAALEDPVQAKALQALANDAVAAFASGDPAASAAKLAADAQSLAAANPLFSQLAAKGLQLAPFALPAALTGNPALAAIAAALGNAGLGHLVPQVIAGVIQPAAGQPAQAAPDGAQTAQVTLPPGHTATVTNTAIPNA